MAVANAILMVPRRQRGLSLIEILVGIVIGMIGVLVIFQVLAVAEERKRNTTLGSDAQSSGAIGLYLLQRDVQLGGYGFGAADTKQLGCTVKASRAGAAFTFPLLPVEIIQPGDPRNPHPTADLITVLRGNSQYIAASRPFTASTTLAKTMQTDGRAGFDFGDLVVVTSDPQITPPGTTTECALVQVTHRPVASDDLEHRTTYQTGITLPPAATTTPEFNQTPNPSFAASNGFAFDLGAQPRLSVWSISNTRLTVVDSLFGLGTEEVAEGVIDLQAEYAADLNGDNLIGANEWTSAAPTGAAPSDPINLCTDDPARSWRCVRAIRVALLSRSGQWDKNHCNANPQWTSGASGTLTATNFSMRNVDGSVNSFGACVPGQPVAAAAQDPNNWRQYRYRVYETVIPLRNVIWGSAP
jgi:type IV pilus assembly protein PilW